MSDVAKPKTGVRRQRSIYQVHYGLGRRGGAEMKPLVLPSYLGVQAFGLQVAGHKKDEDSKYTGLLQCSNGTVLKPILKPSQQREIDFYERLHSSREPDLEALRAFVPAYYGRTRYEYNGHTQEYIVMQDLTLRMLEQCVMDVKIGRRTWDPLATPEKIKSEEEKYVLCKQEFGFCIPGYQVHELATGRLRKYGKDHGKRLHGDAVKDAIKKYLNGFGRSICRALLLQFLSELWRIQKWARRQRRLRLYAASLLLLYDASSLRACCAADQLGARCRPPPARRNSMPSGGGPLGGQLAARGPSYKFRSPRPPPPPPPQASPLTSPWTEALDKLTHHHSFEHNYEDELSKIKVNYRTLLDQLSSDDRNPNPWGTVKIIDFAHAFYNEDDQLATDDNFREGIDSLVAIFESFLKEVEDHVHGV